MKEQKARQFIKGNKWEYKNMKSCEGFYIVKVTEKNIGEVDKVWFEVEKCGNKFETLKDAKNYCKNQYIKKQRLEKARQEWERARDAYNNLRKEYYIWG